MKSALLLVAFAFVCACGKTDRPNNPAVDRPVSDQAASGLPRPGLYAVIMTPEMFGNVPSISIPQESHQACYLPKVMERPDKFFLADVLDCQREEFRFADGEVDAKMVCDTDEGPVPFELQGTYDKDGADLVGDLNFSDGTIRVTRKLTRIGDC